MLYRERLRAQAAILLFAVVVLVSSARSLHSDQSPPAAASEKVSLVVDYGDGVQKHFTAIVWKKGMTVLAAMQAAQSHARGIRFEFRGKGDSSFLTKIDDLENEGNGRNWTYRVNDKLATKSFGVYELSSGDTVLWNFK